MRLKGIFSTIRTLPERYEHRSELALVKVWLKRIDPRLSEPLPQEFLGALDALYKTEFFCTDVLSSPKLVRDALRRTDYAIPLFTEAAIRHPSPWTFHSLYEDDLELETTFLVALLAHYKSHPPSSTPSWFPKVYTRALTYARSYWSDEAKYIAYTSIVMGLGKLFDYVPTKKDQKTIDWAKTSVRQILSAPKEETYPHTLLSWATILGATNTLLPEWQEEIYARTRPTDRARYPWVYKKTPRSITFETLYFSPDPTQFLIHVPHPSMNVIANRYIQSAPVGFLAVLPFLSIEKRVALLSGLDEKLVPLLTRSIFFADELLVSLSKPQWAHLLATSASYVRPWLYSRFSRSMRTQTSSPQPTQQSP